MKRLLFAATLALGAVAASDMQARADGRFGIGIGLNLTFSYGCGKPNACPPTYGCGIPVPYPPAMPWAAAGYPIPGYGGFDPYLAGMGGPPAYPAPYGYGGYPVAMPAPAVHASAE